MPNLRGTALINTARHVRERFGAEAHERILRELDAAAAASFRVDLREAAWKPADHLVAYMERARELLAPGQPDFYRDIGRHAGLHAARESAFRSMLSDPSAATRQSAFLWGAFYDTGRVDLRREGDSLLFSILDFPSPGRALCERQAGFIQGALEAWGAKDVVVEKTACVFDGAPSCQMRATWAAAPGW